MPPERRGYGDAVPRTIDLATLCNAASVREDLLSLLDAGVTTLTAEEFPANVELTLVAQFAFSEPDLGKQETMGVDVTSDDNDTLISETIQVTPERPADADLAIPYFHTWLHKLALSFARPGLYTVTVTMQGASPRRLPLRVQS